MNHYKLVLPAHLNHYGYLFGGDLLKWVDEYAWITASLDYPGCNFVTVGMDQVEFRQSVRQGIILKFVVTQTSKGRTSLQYEVSVFQGNTNEPSATIIFSTRVTFVRIDETGRKAPLPAITTSA